MPRQTPKNFKRPERVAHDHEVVQDQKAATDQSVMRTIPAHYLESQRNNENIDACCRDPNNLTYHTEKTDPALKQANKAVLTCSCGKKHIRFAGGSGAQNTAG